MTWSSCATVVAVTFGSLPIAASKSPSVVPFCASAESPASKAPSSTAAASGEFATRSASVVCESTCRLAINSVSEIVSPSVAPCSSASMTSAIVMFANAFALALLGTSAWKRSQSVPCSRFEGTSANVLVRSVQSNTVVSVGHAITALGFVRSPSEM